MNCQEWEQQVALHVENDLPAEEARRVEEHLAGCAECRELLEDLRASQAALKEIEAEGVDGALLAVVRSGVLSRIGERRRSIWPWAAAVAMAAALMAALLPAPREVAPEPRAAPIARAPVTPPKAEPVVARARSRPYPARPRRTESRQASRGSDPLVVKMLTDDPDIVIIWLVDQTGD
jgi:anti-sigma factor RsiW